MSASPDMASVLALATGLELAGWSWLAGVEVQLPPLNVVPGTGLPADAPVCPDRDESHRAVEDDTFSSHHFAPTLFKQHAPHQISNSALKGRDCRVNCGHSLSLSDEMLVEKSQRNLVSNLFAEQTKGQSQASS